jgi:hypothetical protein
MATVHVTPQQWLCARIRRPDQAVDDLAPSTPMSSKCPTVSAFGAVQLRCDEFRVSAASVAS